MPSQPITDYQFKELLTSTRKMNNKFISARDIMFYEILWFLGFRPSEARLIKISEINFYENTIFIPAENNKERHADYFPIPKKLIKKIKSYIKKIPFRTQWLFPCFHNPTRKKDIPIHIWCVQRDFTNRIRQLGFLHASSFYKDNKRQTHNLNLYSFRKRFGTHIYKKTKDPQATALLLRQYDRQLKSVWAYVFTAEKDNRRQILEKIYS